MLKEQTLKVTARRAAIIVIALGAAVAAQANVITYNMAFPLSGVGTGTQMDTTSLLKFNPSLGTLTSATITNFDYAFSESSITNLTAKKRFESQSSFASDKIKVSTGGLISVVGSISASTSQSGPLLGGVTNDLVDAHFGGGSSTFTSMLDLAEFTGLGTLTVTNNTTTSGSAIGQGSYSAFTNNFAEAQASVTYDYKSVPSPAAAATMLIGVVGGIARRRRLA